MQIGGFLQQRFVHQMKPRHDAAAEIMVVGGNRINGYCRATAHHHAGIVAKLAAAQRVEPAVCAVFFGIAIVVNHAQRVGHGSEPFNRALQAVGNGFAFCRATHG